MLPEVEPPELPDVLPEPLEPPAPLLRREPFRPELPDVLMPPDEDPAVVEPEVEP